MALRIARTLAAMTVEFEQVVTEELQALGAKRAGLIETGSSSQDVSDFRSAVGLLRRDAASLGHPLVAEIAASLDLILASVEPTTLPLDIIDAHIDVMWAVLGDRALSRESASVQVAELVSVARAYAAEMSAPDAQAARK